MDVPCTWILFCINFALNDLFLPSELTSGLTFGDFDMFFNTSEVFLKVKLVDEEPILVRAIP